MPKTDRIIRTLLIMLALLLVLVSVGYIVLIKVIDLDTYKPQILAELEKSLKRHVTYSSGQISFSLGPAVSFQDVIVRDSNDAADFIKIKNLTCQLELLPLFHKKMIIHGFVADKAVLNLERRNDGKFNFSDMIERSPSESALKIHDLKLKDSDISFTDRLPQQTPVITKFLKTDLNLHDIDRGGKTAVKLSTTLGGGASGSLQLGGRLRLSPNGTTLFNSSLEAKLACKQLDLSHYWPYYSKYVPFKKILGTLDTDMELKGRLDEFSSTGKVTLQSIHFDYQPVFRRAITSKNIKLKYQFELNRQDIKVKAFEADVDGAEVKGSFALKDYRSSDPRITTQAVSGKLDFEKYKQFVPYGIIVKDTAEWIEEHIAGGIYQLDEGKLDGRISQILHMEKGTNYDILYIKARAEKGVVTYGSKVPTFNNIKGTLELKGKDFLLHGMSGNFGTSPMTLEGRITDYPLDSPSGYPFKMVISPTRNEVAWLTGKGISSNLGYNGNSSLTLNGEGFTSGYNLFGEWNLSPSAFSYANYISKPVGTSSIIKFRGSLNAREAVLTNLNFTLGGLILDFSAKYPYSSDKNLDILINSNQFNTENISPLSPYLLRYQPSGRAQISLKAVIPASFDRVKLTGTAILNSASFKYSQIEKPVSGVSGSISFDDESFESSYITARVGNSFFAGKGAINSLTPFAFSAAFTSPQIDLADFGFRHSAKNPLFTKVKGDISFKENNLNIKSLSGTVNNSHFSVVGTVSDLDKSKADLSIYSSYLDISDLLLITGIENIGTKPIKSASVSPAITLNLKAEKGVANATEFRKLNTSMNYSNKVLQITSLETEILGGRLSAKGKIDTQTVPVSYQAEFKLANASADEISSMASDRKKEITGVMSLDGSFNAKGDTHDAFKKSAYGSITIHSERGSLRHFSILSKVFSILNVSQLFKFRLPDMVSEGMPYSEIKGTLAFREGIIATNDLFISSNAMNISFVGRHDMVNDKLNMTVGVQPLQTVDKVVSRIPIVGWILTGKEKSLISTYFEVKGKSSAPEVTAIPVTSLGKGVLGIFKRVFQLPAKLITDTGEVVLGN